MAEPSLAMWLVMMPAMMLPSAVPAVASYVHMHRRSTSAALFVVPYVGIWMLVGVAAYSVYRPPSTTTAVVITVVAIAYELTPIKRRARQRCQQGTRSGFHYGIYCLGSSIGLMLLLLAWGAMSVTWMSVIAAIVLVQKLIPVKGATS